MGSASAAISSSDLIDAKLEEHQLCAGSKHCPGCGHKLFDIGRGGKQDWLGLPAGVKFDPTDQELIEHLEAKVEAKHDMKSHPLIDEFIPTIEGEDGICYTHPEKLPGVTRDGLSRHFFHRPSKAYTTGTRKRRKIQNECDLQGGETRWHKTGKTRPVMVNGKQKGCKKILVLYTNFGKNRKPEKTNWVMHQYHLGQHEEEKEGELVVSKIFYQTQPRQCNWVDRSGVGGTNVGLMTVGGGGGGGGGEGSTSGSCSSSKEVIIHHGQRESGLDQLHGAVAAVMSSYSTPMEIAQQMKSHDQHHHFGFTHFRKSGFDEVGMVVTGGGGEASTAREGGPAQTSGTCDEIGDHHHHHQNPHHHQTAPHQHQHLAHDHPHQQQQQQRHAVALGHHHHQNIAATSAAAAFHISRPSPPISAIISPPPIHHTSIILDQDPYHVSRLMLHNEIHQQQQQQQEEQERQQQHHKMVGGRSASGLEELIMGCTSSSAASDIKEESSIANPQEAAEWMKTYSSFWPDPDNQDHHG
ncbi:unnamed protein product [Linum tenue]|uniref:NAC domain-containing protein n=2 Tax=Linum tenue TaxID=586396 RepID=A0AAV0QDI6_9ROSI|nr:unnamed protein product [Linum tenue]